MQRIAVDGVELAHDDTGEGPAIVLLHGLTATRAHVVMGSRVLSHSGWRVVAYDARGHGESSAPADPSGYGYQWLVADLTGVLDAVGLERAVLAGASMGAHTAAALAMGAPERVAGLVLITPAYDPDDQAMAKSAGQFGELSAGLRRDGIDGFLEAYGRHFVTEPWREPVLTELRQRMSAHTSLDAVADALELIPSSRPFTSLADLVEVRAPALVVASRDEPDPMHPLSLAQAYAEALSDARLEVEEPDQVPLAWQGARLSRLLADFAERVMV